MSSLLAGEYFEEANSGLPLKLAMGLVEHSNGLKGLVFIITVYFVLHY